MKNLPEKLPRENDTQDDAVNISLVLDYFESDEQMIRKPKSGAQADKVSMAYRLFK